MRVLVCGGAGYIGTQLVRELLRSGEHEVIIVDNLQTTKGFKKHVQTEQNYKAKVATGKLVENVDKDVVCHKHRFAKLEIGDVRDTQFLDGVFKKYDPINVVVHMCAFSIVPQSVTDPFKFYDNNIIGMLRLLQTMHAHKCDKIIFSSTCSIYGNSFSKDATTVEQFMKPIPVDAAMIPENPYAVTKLTCEYMLKDCAVAYGIKSVSFRYFNAAGADLCGDIGQLHDPQTHLIPIILRVALADKINAHNAKHHPQLPPVPSHVSIFGTDYPTVDGTCVRDYIHVKDLSSAHVLAIDYLNSINSKDTDHFFTAFNLGTGHGYSVREVIEAARRVTGHPIPAIDAPRRAGDPAVLVASGNMAEKVLN